VNDCRNAEIRDQLPDLLHDRLNAGARAAVLAHVDGCAECREELELLRRVRQVVILSTPRIDTARIVSMLPKPGASAVVPIRPSRSRWADWRIAATITVLAVGGTSVALLTHSSGVVGPDSIAVAPVVSVPRGESTLAPPTMPVRGPELSTTVAESSANDAAPGDPGSAEGVDGRLTGLSEQQLRALLDDIGQLKATPITEPEPVNIKVEMKSSSGSRGDTEMQ
jgi:anti-sigma factor RsiW